ncbi:hypothetical protein [Flavobacterium sp. GCM10027622]|uniref:hypothetical protein n=1 Tax=unclassified Flavobacterium TaxID=196869 RepID=UPI00361C3D7F
MLKRIIASIIVILAGVLTITDKIYTFHFTNNYGFYDSQTLVWTFTQMIAPIILILGFTLNPFKISFTVPVYLYSVQIYFIFSSLTSDKGLVHLYAIGSVLLFIVCVIVFNFIFKEERSKEEQITALEALLDLHIAIHAKK